MVRQDTKDDLRTTRGGLRGGLKGTREDMRIVLRVAAGLIGAIVCQLFKLIADGIGEVGLVLLRMKVT